MFKLISLMCPFPTTFAICQRRFKKKTENCGHDDHDDITMFRHTSHSFHLNSIQFNTDFKKKVRFVHTNENHVKTSNFNKLILTIPFQCLNYLMENLAIHLRFWIHTLNSCIAYFRIHRLFKLVELKTVKTFLPVHICKNKRYKLQGM